MRYPYRVLAAALALSGRIEEAACGSGRDAASLSQGDDQRISDAGAVDRSCLSRWYREIEGMRLAGIPE
jgi:hypothetical protein